jgi:microcystin-dependent protein
VEDGAYTLVFKLYTVDNGGTALWTETQDNVVVTHGVFSVELGSVTSLPNIDAGQVYYLGIAAQGGAEMQPRAKLHKAFAANITAAMAGTTNNIPSSGLARLDSIKFTDNSVMRTADPNAIGVPIGGIIMWSGTSVSLPPNWKVCDGTSGTPDLRDRFIVGAGSTYSVGNTGGATTVTLTTAQMPSHNHTGNTSTNGDHAHNYWQPNIVNFSLQSNTNDFAGRTKEYVTENGGTTTTNGNHNHSFTTNSSGSGQSHENRPPYYALYYIMKISN